MSDDKIYKDKDIVWVKLGNYWWPGEVWGPKRHPTGFPHKTKGKPYCVVKFFQEHSFEYVKSSKHILPFNCSRKDEFIRKGYDLVRVKGKFMEKFPADVSTAERLTRSVTRSSVLLNSRPDSIVKAVIGQSLTQNRSTDNRQHCDSVTKIINITPTRPATENASNTSPSYKCNLCEFQSTRQNVMVLHRKSHSAGMGIAKRNSTQSSSPTVEKIDDDKLTTATEEPQAKAKPVNQPKARNQNNQTVEKIKPSTSANNESNSGQSLATPKPSVTENTVEKTSQIESPNISKGRSAIEEKKSDGIQKSFLSDWVDEEKDGDHGSSAGRIQQQTTTLPQIVSCVAISGPSEDCRGKAEATKDIEISKSPNTTEQEKPVTKIRNIPKKDRRHLFLEEFNSPTTPPSEQIAVDETSNIQQNYTDQPTTSAAVIERYQTIDISGDTSPSDDHSFESCSDESQRSPTTWINHALSYSSGGSSVIIVEDMGNNDVLMHDPQSFSVFDDEKDRVIDLSSEESLISESVPPPIEIINSDESSGERPCEIISVSRVPNDMVTGELVTEGSTTQFRDIGQRISESSSPRHFAITADKERLPETSSLQHFDLTGKTGLVPVTNVAKCSEVLDDKGQTETEIASENPGLAEQGSEQISYLKRQFNVADAEISPPADSSHERSGDIGSTSEKPPSEEITVPNLRERISEEHANQACDLNYRSELSTELSGTIGGTCQLTTPGNPENIGEESVVSEIDDSQSVNVAKNIGLVPESNASIIPEKKVNTEIEPYAHGELSGGIGPMYGVSVLPYKEPAQSADPIPNENVSSHSMDVEHVSVTQDTTESDNFKVDLRTSGISETQSSKLCTIIQNDDSALHKNIGQNNDLTDALAGDKISSTRTELTTEPISSHHQMSEVTCSSGIESTPEASVAVHNQISDEIEVECGTESRQQDVPVHDFISEQSVLNEEALVTEVILLEDPQKVHLPIQTSPAKGTENELSVNVQESSVPILSTNAQEEDSIQTKSPIVNEITSKPPVKNPPSSLETQSYELPREHSTSPITPSTSKKAIFTRSSKYKSRTSAQPENAASQKSTKSLSCFDFQEEEDTEVLSNLGNYKKRHMSSEKKKDIDEKDILNPPDKITDDKGYLKIRPESPFQVTTYDSHTIQEAKKLPIKERGKRFFKHRCRSNSNHYAIVEGPSQTVQLKDQDASHNITASQEHQLHEDQPNELLNPALNLPAMDHKLVVEQESAPHFNDSQPSIVIPNTEVDSAVVHKNGTSTQVANVVEISQANEPIPACQMVLEGSPDNHEDNVSSSGIEAFTEPQTDSDSTMKNDIAVSGAREEEHDNPITAEDKNKLTNEVKAPKVGQHTMESVSLEQSEIVVENIVSVENVVIVPLDKADTFEKTEGDGCDKDATSSTEQNTSIDQTGDIQCQVLDQGVSSEIVEIKFINQERALEKTETYSNNQEAVTRNTKDVDDVSPEQSATDEMETSSENAGTKDNSSKTLANLNITEAEADKQDENLNDQSKISMESTHSANTDMPTVTIGHLSVFEDGQSSYKPMLPTGVVTNISDEYTHLVNVTIADNTAHINSVVEQEVASLKDPSSNENEPHDRPQIYLANIIEQEEIVSSEDHSLKENDSHGGSTIFLGNIIEQEEIVSSEDTNSKENESLGEPKIFLANISHCPTDDPEDYSGVDAEFGSPTSMLDDDRKMNVLRTPDGVPLIDVWAKVPPTSKKPSPLEVPSRQSGFFPPNIDPEPKEKDSPTDESENKDQKEEKSCKALISLKSADILINDESNIGGNIECSTSDERGCIPSNNNADIENDTKRSHTPDESHCDDRNPLIMLKAAADLTHANEEISAEKELESSRRCERSQIPSNKNEAKEDDVANPHKTDKSDCSDGKSSKSDDNLTLDGNGNTAEVELKQPSSPTSKKDEDDENNKERPEKSDGDDYNHGEPLDLLKTADDLLTFANVEIGAEEELEESPNYEPSINSPNKNDVLKNDTNIPDSSKNKISTKESEDFEKNIDSITSGENESERNVVEVTFIETEGHAVQDTSTCSNEYDVNEENSADQAKDSTNTSTSSSSESHDIDPNNKQGQDQVKCTENVLMPSSNTCTEKELSEENLVQAPANLTPSSTNNANEQNKVEHSLTFESDKIEVTSVQEISSPCTSSNIETKSQSIIEEILPQEVGRVNRSRKRKTKSTFNKSAAFDSDDDEVTSPPIEHFPEALHHKRSRAYSLRTSIKSKSKRRREQSHESPSEDQTFAEEFINQKYEVICSEKTGPNVIETMATISSPESTIQQDVIETSSPESGLGIGAHPHGIIETIDPNLDESKSNEEVIEQEEVLSDWSKSSPDVKTSDIAGEELSAVEALLLIPNHPSNILDSSHDFTVAVPVAEDSALGDEKFLVLDEDVREEIAESIECTRSQELEQKFLDDDQKSNVRRKRRCHMKVTPRKRVVDNSQYDNSIEINAGTSAKLPKVSSEISFGKSAAKTNVSGSHAKSFAEQYEEHFILKYVNDQTKPVEYNDKDDTDVSSKSTPEKVHINVDISNPLSSQIATILGSHRSPGSEYNHFEGVMKRKTLEDDIPSFIIKRPTKVCSEMKTTDQDTIAQIQHLCPQVEITRKPSREEYIVLPSSSTKSNKVQITSHQTIRAGSTSQPGLTVTTKNIGGEDEVCDPSPLQSGTQYSSMLPTTSTISSQPHGIPFRRPSNVRTKCTPTRQLQSRDSASPLQQHIIQHEDIEFQQQNAFQNQFLLHQQQMAQPKFNQRHYNHQQQLHQNQLQQQPDQHHLPMNSQRSQLQHQQVHNPNLINQQWQEDQSEIRVQQHQQKTFYQQQQPPSTNKHGGLELHDNKYPMRSQSSSTATIENVIETSTSTQYSHSQPSQESNYKVSQRKPRQTASKRAPNPSQSKAAIVHHVPASQMEINVQQGSYPTRPHVQSRESQLNEASQLQLNPTTKPKAQTRGRRGRQAQKAENVSSVYSDCAKTTKAVAGGRRPSSSNYEFSSRGRTTRSAANRRNAAKTTITEVQTPMEHGFVVSSADTYHTTTVSQLPSNFEMHPSTCTITEPTQVIPGIQIRTPNGGVGYAVPSLPVSGYPQTFLLCELIDNQYQEVSEKPLYLSPDGTHFFEVPDELVTDAHRKLNDCQRTPKPEMMQLTSNVTQSQQELTTEIQDSSHSNANENTKDHMDMTQNCDALTVEEQATALLCLQEQVIDAQNGQEHHSQEQIVQEQLVQEHLITDQFTQEQLVQEQFVQKEFVPEQFVQEQFVQDKYTDEQYVHGQFIHSQEIDGQPDIIQVATLEPENGQENIVEHIETQTVAIQGGHNHSSSVTVSVGDQQIVVDEGFFIRFVNQNGGNVSPEMQSVTITSSLIESMVKTLTDAGAIATVQIEGESGEQHQVLVDGSVLAGADLQNGMFALTLHGTELYSEEQFIDSGEILQIQTPDGLRLISATSEENSVFQPMTRHIPAKTHETSVLLNQTPKMSTNVSTSRSKPKIDCSISSATTLDCLNVIGVQSPMVPTSLETHNSISIPATITKNRITNAVSSIGLSSAPNPNADIRSIVSNEQQLRYGLYNSNTGTRIERTKIRKNEFGEYTIASSGSTFDDPAR